MLGEMRAIELLKRVRALRKPNGDVTSAFEVRYCYTLVKQIVVTFELFGNIALSVGRGEKPPEAKKPHLLYSICVSKQRRSNLSCSAMEWTTYLQSAGTIFQSVHI